MIVKLHTPLELSAETACRMAQRPNVFRHVIWPMLRVGATPERIAKDQEVSARLYFLGFLPAWRHHVRLASIEPHELRSIEHGGLVKAWNHRLTFEPTSERSCIYTDEVEIHAGLATLPTVLFAHVIYRWRQRRWRRLARLIGE